MNPHLLYWQVDFFPTEPPGKLIIFEGVITKVNKAYVLFSKRGENRQEAVLDMSLLFYDELRLVVQSVIQNKELQEIIKSQPQKNNGTKSKGLGNN